VDMWSGAKFPHRSAGLTHCTTVDADVGDGGWIESHPEAAEVVQDPPSSTHTETGRLFTDPSTGGVCNTGL